MIVCLCRGLSERDLRGLLAGGLQSTDELSRSCGAGGDCGACLAMIDRLVEDVRGHARHGGALVPVGACA
jgi:bacterioferritin-associated ferredoxin